MASKKVDRWLSEGYVELYLMPIVGQPLPGQRAYFYNEHYVCNGATCFSQPVGYFTDREVREEEASAYGGKPKDYRWVAMAPPTFA